MAFISGCSSGSGSWSGLGSSSSSSTDETPQILTREQIVRLVICVHAYLSYPSPVSLTRFSMLPRLSCSSFSLIPFCNPFFPFILPILILFAPYLRPTPAGCAAERGRAQVRRNCSTMAPHRRVRGRVRHHRLLPQPLEVPITPRTAESQGALESTGAGVAQGQRGAVPQPPLPRLLRPPRQTGHGELDRRFPPAGQEHPGLLQQGPAPPPTGGRLAGRSTGQSCHRCHHHHRHRHRCSHYCHYCHSQRGQGLGGGNRFCRLDR
ncbi:hypothetical protein B484DRAFT_218957 [Ochromonadaceae sp. CCMP2298]|nr:hypothetical protein B484DRAFT_218957 [Ochromonadaceae sp. CCMP2298]